MRARILFLAAILVSAAAHPAFSFSLVEIPGTEDPVAVICATNGPVRAAYCMEDLHHLYSEWKYFVRSSRLSYLSPVFRSDKFNAETEWRRNMDKVRELDGEMHRWERRYGRHIIARPGQR